MVPPRYIVSEAGTEYPHWVGKTLWIILTANNEKPQPKLGFFVKLSNC
jgi:hypothetical protein